ncbi:copper-binding protein [Halorhabdus sp. CBA1104]|uniref:NosD domain-containing protein n=1 Tax=Halorhabdus sp. CBA1104 TaxID=1380432 RepID=UPI0012B279C7|nr:NosD domain-containing protein [Halorhabdus sp. CBA1104]QGN06664.1 copper-binding protein [Halorhabdus sp. CBA1104]
MRVVVVLAGLAVVLAGGSLAFAVHPASGVTVEPVAFSETLTTGLTGVDVRQAEDAGYEVPRVEVFFSEYQYVRGYYGVQSAVSEVTADRTTRQFGRPVGVFVTDFADAGPSVTEAGYLTVASDPAVDWSRASTAYFVVDSAARTPAGPAIVPFGNRVAARSFATEYGGEIRQWTDLRSRDDTEPAVAVENQVTDRREWASRTVDDRGDLLDRRTSIVVGEDAPTLSDAIEAAPPNTTVRLPSGTYRANLTIDKPLTIRGSGAETRIVGDGNGTVLRVRSPRTALLDLSITGGGSDNTGSPPDAGANGSWDETIRNTYGYGDAAVGLDAANRSLVAGVVIETPANGIIARDSDGVVVGNVSIEGSQTWREGFMSVLAIESRMVVQNSTFQGGRDAVYTHHADGIVVRDNRMTGMRFGVHEMFTSRSLVANNTVSETNIGIVVMTRPRSNAVLDNRVTDSGVGVSMSGSASLTTGNVLLDNQYGLDLGTQRSVYARNVLLGNEAGLRTGTIVPTNHVTANDIVDNDRYVSTGRGPVRLWSGNYWGPIPGRDRDSDGTIARPFRPSGVVDRAVGTSDGSGTLARSPAVAVLQQFQASVRGLRSANVVDDAPRSQPVRHEELTAARNATTTRAGHP